VIPIKRTRVFFEKLRVRNPFLILALLAMIATSFPVILSIWYKADFIDLANETVAYRYFFVERINNGEPIVIGVGHLLSVLHSFAYFFASYGNHSSVDLRHLINVFSNTTNILILSMQCILLGLVVVLDTLTKSQKFILISLPVIFLFGFGFAGFDYTLMPDYLHLNMLIVLISATVFFSGNNNQDLVMTYKRAFFYAMLIGILVTNKVSLLPIIIFSFAPIFLNSTINNTLSKTKVFFTLIIGMLAGALVVFMLAYKFAFSNIPIVVVGWFKFFLNPGSQPDFWTEAFSSHLFIYNYFYYLAFYLITVFVIIYFNGFNYFYRYKLYLMWILTCAFYIYALYKRPAGTTFFESSQWLFCLAMLIAGIQKNKRIIRVIPSILGVFLILAFYTFPFRSTIECTKNSKLRTDIKEEFFLKTQKLSQDGKLIVFFRDNSLHHEGFHELLIKGASDFPTWKIGETGDLIFRRYFGNMEVRSSYVDGTYNLPLLDSNDVLLVFQTPLEFENGFVEKFIGRSQSSKNNLLREDWRLYGKCGGGFIVGSLFYNRHF
jgi:hypothetical protein